MKKEVRTAAYDEELKLEAYRLEGFVRPFPEHFHEYYVFGYLEEGQRLMSCKNKDYALGRGDIVLFNPHEIHCCRHIGEKPLDYRGINLPEDTMADLIKEITGEAKLPFFPQNVVQDEEAAGYLRRIHQNIMEENCIFEKEENVLLLVSLLVKRYGQEKKETAEELPGKNMDAVEKVCSFLEEHFNERICLDQLCRFVGLSKSTLLRKFTEYKGVTPYRYLENIRISQAKKLLEKGCTPIETAMRTGFSDQSHFTNYFNSFIGLSPGMYREIFMEKEEAGEKENGR